MRLEARKWGRHTNGGHSWRRGSIHTRYDRRDHAAGEAALSADVRQELDLQKANTAVEQERRQRAETERDAALQEARAREIALQQEQSARQEVEQKLREREPESSRGLLPCGTGAKRKRMR